MLSLTGEAVPDEWLEPSVSLAAAAIKAGAPRLDVRLLNATGAAWDRFELDRPNLNSLKPFVVVFDFLDGHSLSASLVVS